MYDIPNQLYLEVADRLIARFGTSDYFSGTLSLDYEGVMCSLRLSAIIYRRRERCDEGERLLIADVVPVWWEFHTMGSRVRCSTIFHSMFYANTFDKRYESDYFYRLRTRSISLS